MPRLPEFLTINLSPSLASLDESIKRSEAPAEAEISNKASGSVSQIPTKPSLVESMVKYS